MSAKAELAEKAKNYIDNHYQEKFSLKKIADILYVNESYLLRTFSSEIGMTMLNYHNHIRCLHAAEMLKTTDQSISFISDQAGFVSAAHFSRIFKKHFGYTPSEYRKQKID